MADNAARFVLIWGYTNLAGVNVITTLLFLAEDSSEAQIVFLRGEVDAGATCIARFQSSQDQKDWSDDPGPAVASVDVERIREAGHPQKWFRARIELGGQVL